jgi:CheY-like chemotaxis protein
MGFKRKTLIFQAIPPSSPNVMRYNNFVTFEVSTMSPDLPEQGTLKILVVDDHELILSGTLDLLKRQYPQAQILTAKTTQNALQQVEAFEPDLVIMDLSLPETFGNTAEINRGIKSLGTLMKNYPTLNLVVKVVISRHWCGLNQTSMLMKEGLP